MKRTFNITGSLRGRMTLIFGLIILIGCLMLAYISETRAGSILEAEASAAMLKVVKQVAETVDSRIQARIYAVESIAGRDVIRGRLGDHEANLGEKLQILNNEVKKAESLGFKRFGIADKNGQIIYNDGSGANIADMDYFKASLEGRTFVSSTLVSEVDNSVVFIYATPIRDYSTNEIIGVLAGMVDGAKFNDLVSSVTYGRTGYALAVDRTGKTIAHKDAERVVSQENIQELAKSNQSLVPLAAIISKMAKGEEGVDSYTFQGQKKIIAYAPIKTTGWSVALTAPTAEVLERTADLRQVVLLVSIVIILAVLALTFIMAGTVAKPIILAVDHLDLIANGDFTMPMPEVFLHRKDEIGTLARAIDKLQSRLRPLLADLKKGVQILASHSENLSAASEEIASSSNEVAKAIQDVATGAGEQTGALQEIVKLFEAMSLSLEEIYNRLNKVKDNSETASKLANVGKKEMDLLVASIRGVQEAFKIMVSKVTGLTNSVNQVGEIIDVINGIADQTNLLALNAAIEAARAGEAGRGFAVVAEEVRKLAEESRSSSNKIRVLLSNITAETNDVVSTSDEVTRQMTEQLKNVEKSIISFDDILESVVAIMPELEATYRQVDSTVKDKGTVLERVHSVSAVSEENSASAQEIAASTEELSATTEEIAASAQEILSVAKELEEQANNFKV